MRSLVRPARRIAAFNPNVGVACPVHGPLLHDGFGRIGGRRREVSKGSSRRFERRLERERLSQPENDSG